MIVRGYEVDVRKLSARLGGGFVACAPDLKGCLADGETREEALRNLEDAIDCWLAAAQRQRRRYPVPTRVLQTH